MIPRHQLLTVIIITFLVLFVSINPLLASSKSICCSYPSHTTSIKFFIPHTITVFIFSSSPNPSIHSNDLYLLPSPSPSHLPSSIINQFNHHRHAHKFYPKTNIKLLSMDNESTAKQNKTPSAEIQRDSSPFNLNVTESLIDKIQNVLSSQLTNIRNMFTFLFSKLYTITNKVITLMINLCVEIKNIYHKLKHFQFNTKFEGILKTIYNAMNKNMREYIVDYTKQCPVDIFPSHIPSIAAQQICAILLIGSSILIMLICIFIGVWLWYKNMINQYLKDTA